MRIVPRTFRVDLELEKLSSFLDTLTKHLQAQENSLRKELEELTKDLDYEAEHDVYDFYYDEIKQITGEFPKLLYSGFLVTWYSFIETTLLRICEEYNLSVQVRAQDRDLMETGIFRARKFLSKAVGYEINNDHWKELKFINTARNRIVHSEGIIYAVGALPEDAAKNYQEWKLSDEITIFLEIDKDRFDYYETYSLIQYKGPHCILVPTHDFCFRLIEFAKELTHLIYDNLG